MRCCNPTVLQPRSHRDKPKQRGVYLSEAEVNRSGEICSLTAVAQTANCEQSRSWNGKGPRSSPCNIKVTVASPRSAIQPRNLAILKPYMTGPPRSVMRDRAGTELSFPSSPASGRSCSFEWHSMRTKYFSSERTGYEAKTIRKIRNNADALAT